MNGRVIRAEKHKWDGTVSSVGPARLVAAPGDAVAWYVAAGSERLLPSKESSERVANHELWVAVQGEWWVLCGECAEDGEITGYMLHAATSFEVPGPDLLVWIDLDLDYEVHGDNVALEDEAQFHAHARSMSYPDEVVRGAWSGISTIAPRYTTGEWPFDGWMGQCLAAAVAGHGDV
jgi:protein associated with RNAse G/E